MYRILRYVLIATVLLAAYVAALAVYQIPYGWLIAIAALAVLILRRKKQRLTAHGTARWAELEDLDGMIDGKGIILGHTTSKADKLGAVMGLFKQSVSHKTACQRFVQAFQRKATGRHLVYLTDAVHTSIFAPSGAGKNVSIVEPFLLTSPESCLVTDIKGENADISWEFREKILGQTVMRLDPWKLTTSNPSCCNVLDLIDPDDPEALDKIRALAEAMVEMKPDAKEPHWPRKARLFDTGVIAGVVHLFPPERRSLQEVAEIMANKSLLNQMIDALKLAPHHGGLLSRIGHEMAESVGDELQSIISTANDSLSFLGTPAVVESSRCTRNFDLSALYKGQGATIYLIIPLQYMRSHAALMRLWITAFNKYIVSRGISNQRTVNVILDECATVMAGHGEALEEMLTVGRGFKLKVTAIFQSTSQLKKLFPEGQEGVLLANTSQVFFSTQDVNTAKYISDRLGQSTIIVNSGGTSNGLTNNYGQSRSYSRSNSANQNWAQMARSLLKPEEVIALDPRVALTFTPGRPPIWTWLTRYYENDTPTGVTPAKMMLDTACLFLASAILAVMWTGAIYYHTFR
jgi:type IV secretion system protein VirD4